MGLHSRSASGLRFELVRVRVSYVILRKNNRHNGAMSITFRAGIVRFWVKEKMISVGLEIGIGYILTIILAVDRRSCC